MGMVGDSLQTACFFNRTCPSNRSYHAETVSEMVSTEKSPAGTIFRALSMIASMCLLISRYPWEFHNVYIRGTSRIPVNMLRSVLPPLGMLIVAFVPVWSRPERTTKAIRLICGTHNVGAFLFMCGYNVPEMWALKKLWLQLSNGERGMRGFCLVASTASILGFIVAGALYTSDSFCCKDEYQDAVTAFREQFEKDTSSSAIIEAIYGKKVLKNSASGTALMIKKVEFWSEELAGFFILVSHISIWYFSDCRLIELPDLM